MNITLLKNFNNYFNRKIIKLENYTDYTASYIYKQVNGLDFNPNDGVTAEQIFNWSEDWTPDYILVTEQEGSGTQTQTVIKSRWFVTEWVRTRGKQYKASLRRDVISDNLNEVLEAPTFVEKAAITDENNPLIYNKEGLEVNQIKHTETALKDETGCGWVVGYIPNDAFKSQEIIEKEVIVSTENADIIVNSLDEWSYWKNVRTNPNYKYMSYQEGNANITVKVKNYMQVATGSTTSIKIYNGFKVNFTSSAFTNVSTDRSEQVNNSNVPSWWNSYSGMEFLYHTGQGDHSTFSGGEKIQRCFTNIIGNSTFNGYVTQLIGGGTEIGTQSDINDLLGLRSKIIKDSSTAKYYRIRILTISSDNPVEVTTSTTAGTNIINFINNNIIREVGSTNDKSMMQNNIVSGQVTVQLASTAYALELEQISVGAFVTLGQDRFHLEDSPYDMFCIPYSEELQLYDGSTTFTCVKQVALAMGTAIAEKTGAANVYDVQLLPYCPARHIIASSQGNIYLDLTKGKYNIIYKTDATYGYQSLSSQPSDQSTFEAAVALYGTLYYLEGGEYVQESIYVQGHKPYYRRQPVGSEKMSAVIWCMSSSFQVPLDYSLSIPRKEGNSLALDTKISNECDLYRLCSPNYNGMFEFSVAKSKGVDSFIAECTYKPYNPYIHVTPILKGLYQLPEGTPYSDIDDARGLICGGDFSLPQLSNAWSNYELNNKNYQKVFDRQIQNMDVNNAIANQQAKWGIAAGVVGAGTAGALTGAKVGGIPGAVLGTVVGAGLSGLGGAMDYQNLQKQQAEAKSYTSDMYNFGLQNIQAIPTSLTKSSALTWNTRIWPFVEYYTCTDVEKQALTDKITYNGMTVMKIDTIGAYKQDELSFIKGQIIRLDTLQDDSHMANEIYNEINKGVYL